MNATVLRELRYHVKPKPKPCSAGKYSGGGSATCAECPIGTYSSDERSTFCSRCPQGFYANSTGSTACISCPAGFQCDTTSCNSIKCDPVSCPPGTYSFEKATSCLPCPGGYRCRGGNKHLCEAGTFSSPGSGECTPCVGGSYCAAGSEFQSQCPPEYYCKSSTEKVPCRVGFYCPAGSTMEVPCAAGFKCESPSSKVECNTPGFYCGEGSVKEVECKAGFVCSDFKQMKACPSGYFCSAAAVKPEDCPPGSFCVERSAEPTLCAAGYFTSVSNKDACNICKKGTFSKPGATQCSDCHEGTYSEEGAGECSKCTEGYVCKRGAARKPCDNGFFCPDGGIKEVPCAKGSFNPRDSRNSPLDCLPCPEHQSTEKDGSDDISFCKCMEGFYVDLGTKGSNRTCIKCSEGLNCDGLDFQFDRITSKRGFYFNKNDTSQRAGEAIAVRCTPDSSCLDGSRCAEGYKASSPLCSICEVNATIRYYRSGSIQNPKECKECSHGELRVYQVLLLIAAFLGSCFFLSFLVKKKIDAAKKDHVSKRRPTVSGNYSTEAATVSESSGGPVETGEQATPPNPLGRRYIGKSNASVLQRAALNHLQIIGLLGRFNFKWTSSVKTLFATTESLSAASITNGFDIFPAPAISVDESIKCLLYSPSLPYPANEMLVNVYILGAMSGAVCLFWLIMGRGKPAVSNVLISLIVLFYMMYSKILRSFFQVFACTQLNGFFTEFRLEGALDVKCSLEDARYRISMLNIAIPVALTYLIPLPLFAFWKLTTSDRESEKVLCVYGFLYSGYKKEYWYWEILVLLRKILVAAISVFLSAEVSSANDLQVNSSKYQQGLLATLVVSVALYIQLKLEPYERDALNVVESTGLIVSVLSLYLGLWTFHSSERYEIDNLVTFLIFAINGSWFLYTFISLFNEYKLVKYIYLIIGCRKNGGFNEWKKREADPTSKVASDTNIESSIDLEGRRHIGSSGRITKVSIGKGGVKQGTETLNKLHSAHNIEMTAVHGESSKNEVINPLAAALDRRKSGPTEMK